jgi:hypothetical protein
MTKEAIHTPTPWVRDLVQDGEFTGLGDNPPGYAGEMVESNDIVSIDPDTGEADWVASCSSGHNADFICRVVNAHDGLLAAQKVLKEACELWDKGFVDGEQFEHDQFIAWVNNNRRAAREAIAAVEGK